MANDAAKAIRAIPEASWEQAFEARFGKPEELPDRTSDLKAKAWLRAMTKQGEDNIWRGAERALHRFERVEMRRDHLLDALLELVEAVQLEADSENGVSRQLGEALEDARRAL